MRRLVAALALGLALCFAATGAQALSPDEMLSNPVLEKRARNISAELRCMVCQNESIDDSNADLARDLRVLVRERLVAGDTDEQVLEFLVARYGEFVLLRPRLQMSTLLLWGFPIVVLLAGGVAIILSIRRRRATAVDTAPLSETENQQLHKLFTGTGD
ncbi:cytochrome c-type biogenesis protein [Phyllobacterium endophyticum]|uniref:cytochrome c-type biogenesis protein n=1 Tax=Phyllobacterium endophyticum TaxID=1149773 RepID=UPI0011CB6DF5|nr:cytochrome c-type biogenesis protein [Phyllobacterium endophyticum]TXR49924.1 cytochrome c-type biogenesis protein CcmH [Phyllobacterium endophyticum]